MRLIEISAGRASLRARLLATPTADRIWAALPIRSTAEMWGQALLLETPVESGRERGARVLLSLGDIAFVPDQDRIAIVLGPTPISRPGELRLGSPANVFAVALDDVRALAGTRAGGAVVVRRAAADTAASR